MGHAEGDHRPGSFHHQDQDHRSPREEVLCLDRRLHPGLPLHLPADVDLQAGVRRVRPLYHAQEVLLSVIILSLIARSIEHSHCSQCANKYTNLQSKALFNPVQYMRAPLSHKAMKFVEAARYGGSRRSVAKCEHRYTCSLGMDILKDLF